MKRIEALIPRDKLQRLVEELEENHFKDIVHFSVTGRGRAGHNLPAEQAPTERVELMVENEEEKLAVNIISRICRRKDSDSGRIIIYSSVKVITIHNGNESL
ncbi:nitrogen regulatory protein P-II [Syntrophobotulus glycolicus DSM 8271]|uniref:Nitrogen regulatory protein P-II n=1 Tax=Syntrophobotulus glycolicus (strain DSM 8271 / FlGlyR) TaxID=645991 RepID=F0T2J5_SYNGF|nr:P-II family nitrogen regulator [Syntrophobotulus glycolicus]ADY55313.1 nitrogen regulatory protein P-II [Syntrophobotulus glycolicus DSM 8271]